MTPERGDGVPAKGRGAGPGGEALGLAIDTTDLRKDYGAKSAVRRLVLEVPRGSIFGFLGPNGAGKSTSVKMLLGLVRPTSGRARVLDAPAGDVAVRRRIGFLPEHFRFYDWLTPAELLRFHGRLCGLSPALIRARVPALLDMVGLTPHRDKRVGAFSKGMMQRIGLAQAIIHEPDLVFLDEPTSGLDPMGRRVVRDVIRSQQARGATIFLNSHLLSEVEVTCDRVAFLRDGEIVERLDVASLAGQPTELTIRARGLEAKTAQALAPWTTAVTFDGDELSCTLRNPDDVPDVVRALVVAGVNVLSVTPRRTSLEDVFVRVMGQDPGL